MAAALLCTMEANAPITEERLLTRVLELGPVESPERARAAIQASLEVLGERLYDEEAKMIARELPAGIAGSLRARPHQSVFGLAEFYDRVARREETRPGFAAEHAQIVCRTLSEMLSKPTLRRLRKHLPEFSELFAVPEAPPSPEP
jgi:uncharacterized protein (DUF2267 family)